MSEPKYTTMVALHHALHQKPVEFANEINGLLADRIQNAVEKKREEIAQSVFGTTDKEPEAVDTVTPEEGAEETGEPVTDDEPEEEETPSEE